MHLLKLNTYIEGTHSYILTTFHLHMLMDVIIVH